MLKKITITICLLFLIIIIGSVLHNFYIIEAHLERAHTQLFECREELTEALENYQCEEDLLIELMESKETSITCMESKKELYKYIEQELKVKNNKTKKPQKSVLLGLLPTGF